MSNTSLLGSFGGQGDSSLMFRNVLINGNFDVWQRGTSVSSTGTGIFQADRWTTTMGATNANYTYARSTDIPNLVSTYSVRVTQNTGQNASSITEYALRQIIEKQNTLGLVGKPVTVSFWYKSSVTGTHGVRIIGSASGYTGGADQNQAFTVSAANTWEYKTLTFTAVQNVTAVTGDMAGIGMYLDIGPRVGGGSGSIGQTSFAGDAYFSLAQVQLEAETATPFERRPIGTELALAQRYYQTGTVGIRAYAVGAGGFNDQSYPWCVTMRIAPNVTFGGSPGRGNSTGLVAQNVYQSGMQLRLMSSAAGDSYSLDEKYFASAEL